MKNLDLLVPKASKETDTFTWATVTESNPLRIRLDGDDTPLSVTPYWLFPTEAQVGARVWVQMNGRSVIVHGPSEGVDFTPAIEDAKDEAILTARTGAQEYADQRLADEVAIIDANIGGLDTRVDDLTTDVGDAVMLATQAKDNADLALSSANDKNKVTFSLNDPGATANTAGDVWFKKNASNRIIGQWEGTGGTTWVAQKIASEVIANLDVGSLTGGYINSGLINTRELIVSGSTTLGTTLDSKETPSGAQAKADTARSGAVGDLKTLWGHPSNTTLIDGGNLYTNTVLVQHLSIGDWTNYLPPILQWSKAAGAGSAIFEDSQGPVAVVYGNGTSNTHWGMGPNSEIPVNTGDEFRFQWAVYTNYGAEYTGYIGNYWQWLRADKSVLSQENGPYVYMGESTYKVVTHDLTVPPNAYYLRFAPFVTANGKGAVRRAWLRRKNAGDLIVDGAIDGKTITGAVFKTNSLADNATAANRRGIIMNSTGLIAYSNGTGGVAAGAATLTINGSTGAITMKGDLTSGSTITGATFRTGTAGERLEVNTDTQQSTIKFFSGHTSESTTSPSYIRADTSGNELVFDFGGGQAKTRPSGPQFQLTTDLTGTNGGSVKMYAQKVVMNVFDNASGAAVTGTHVTTDGALLYQQFTNGSGNASFSIDVQSRVLLRTGTASDKSDGPALEVTNADDTVRVYRAVAPTTTTKGVAYIHDTGWTTASLNSGWGAMAGFSPPGYRIINGVCHLRGVFGTIGTGTPFTLPTNARPLNSLVMLGAAGQGFVRTDVSTSGAITYQTQTPSSYWSLDGICFPVSN